MGVTANGADDRWAAGLAVGGLTSCYWLVAARPLVAVLVGSLVVAGERANGPNGFVGTVPVRAVPAVVAVELAVALQAALAGRPALGVLAGGLFLLAAWLTGPSLMDRRPTR
jgi:hypothetical protein